MRQCNPDGPARAQGARKGARTRARARTAARCRCCPHRPRHGRRRGLVRRHPQRSAALLTLRRAAQEHADSEGAHIRVHGRMPTLSVQPRTRVRPMRMRTSNAHRRDQNPRHCGGTAHRAPAPCMRTRRRASVLALRARSPPGLCLAPLSQPALDAACPGSLGLFQRLP